MKVLLVKRGFSPPLVQRTGWLDRTMELIQRCHLPDDTLSASQGVNINTYYCICIQV